MLFSPSSISGNRQYVHNKCCLNESVNKQVCVCVCVCMCVYILVFLSRYLKQNLERGPERRGWNDRTSQKRKSTDEHWGRWGKGMGCGNTPMRFSQRPEWSSWCMRIKFLITGLPWGLRGEESTCQCVDTGSTPGPGGLHVPLSP